jgi:hypothetical protein
LLGDVEADERSVRKRRCALARWFDAAIGLLARALYSATPGSPSPPPRSRSTGSGAVVLLGRALDQALEARDARAVGR